MGQLQNRLWFVFSGSETWKTAFSQLVKTAGGFWFFFFRSFTFTFPLNSVPSSLYHVLLSKPWIHVTKSPKPLSECHIIRPHPHLLSLPSCLSLFLSLLFSSLFPFFSFSPRYFNLEKKYLLILCLGNVTLSSYTYWILIKWWLKSIYIHTHVYYKKKFTLELSNILLSINLYMNFNINLCY